MNNTIRNEIETLINARLAEAEVKHRPMNGKHEAYAVLKEEVEEAQEEIFKLKNKLDDVWRMVRTDHGNNNSLLDKSNELREYATLAIYELLQVACVTKRMNKDLRK